MAVVIETTLGDLTVDLFTKDRPQTCLNFLKLCKVKYYNLCLFHSVSANFLAQTGDPTGKGDGGDSIFGVLRGSRERLYQGEKVPRIRHDQPGLLSMVSHGGGMLGSQFIITLSQGLGSLDNEHCVFGQVVEGSEVLLRLNEAITDDQHRPYQDIRITHTVVLEDPYPDPEGLEVPPMSPTVPSLKDAAFSRIPADEPLTENCSQEELDEMVQQREAAARAAILEMVGDLPDADAAPPENVLFVCKLNPVTSDHDLGIIFSRFGVVKSCEVIRDQVSGDSLQYAFVEFTDRKACEDAYFKMDNVLIDDRRIHVDFSQSVAKLRWKGKGRGVEVLGPPPPGGWGGKAKDGKRRYDADRRTQPEPKPARRRLDPPPLKNGREIQLNHRAPKEAKRKEKVKRRKSSSSSSTSESSSETSSSSESSEATRRRRKKSRSLSRKVLVVVKTPRRSKTHKKPRKVRSRAKKYDSDSSDSEELRKKKKKSKKKYSTEEDSSSEEIEVERKKKRKKSTVKRKKKKHPESSEYSSEEERRKVKSKKRRNSASSSDSEPAKKRRKAKVKTAKRRVARKPKKRHRSDTDSTSTSG